jgi:hypothetical protein
MASLLKQYIDRYPRTGAARYWIERYNWSETFDGCAPETIKLHDVYQEYGGPEEGGWWYEVGRAIGTHCILVQDMPMTIPESGFTIARYN